MDSTPRHLNAPGSRVSKRSVLAPVLSGLFAIGLTLITFGDAFSSGDDFGSLPGSGGGGASRLDQRPAPFLEGANSQTLMGLVSAYSGEFSIFEYEVDNGVRWVLRGEDFEVAINEDLLTTRSIRMGVTAADFGGAVVTRLEWPGYTSPGYVIAQSGQLDLAFSRMQDAGILDQHVTVRTVYAKTQETVLTMSSGSGLLTLRQD